MQVQGSYAPTFRCGPFEIDLAAGEVRKNGVKIRLQEQPFQVLAALLETPGTVVTRDQLRLRLWPDDTFVDFDHGLNNAIAKIREALDDSATHPRFVETLPKRGYRFIAPVESSRKPVSDTERELDASAPVLGRKRLYLYAVATVVGALGLLLVAFKNYSAPRSTTDPQVVKFAVAVGQSVHEPSVSPDGRRIAFVTLGDEGALWIRDLSEEKPRRVPGSEGARRPFWSPDSRFVAFGSGDSLKRVRASGDASPIEICKIPYGVFRGGAWRPDRQEIVLPGHLELYRVRASGGEPQLLEASAPERTGAGWRYPSFVPLLDRGLLLIEFETDQLENTIWVVDLETGLARKIAHGRTPVYSTSGHIVYQDTGPTDRIWAVPFSMDSLETWGEPFAVAHHAVAPSVSATGTLVYLRGSSGPAKRIVWRDRSGRPVQVASGPIEGHGYPTLSPGGEALAFTAVANDKRDVWIIDLRETASEPRRLTFEGVITNQFAWSPDGARVLYNARQGGELTLRVRPAKGGEPLQLHAPETPLVSDWWSGDGSREYMVIHTRIQPDDRWVVMVGPPASESTSEFRPIKRSERSALGKLSPDGDYIVYIGGTPEPQVLVRSFPGGDGPWLVSRPGEYAVQPRWSRKGDEVFYVVSDQLIAARVAKEPTFRVIDRVNILRSEGLAEGMFSPQYDVTADGQRFVLLEPVPEEEPRLQVTQNWFEEFRDRE